MFSDDFCHAEQGGRASVVCSTPRSLARMLLLLVAAALSSMSCLVLGKTLPGTSWWLVFLGVGGVSFCALVVAFFRLGRPPRPDSAANASSPDQVTNTRQPAAELPTFPAVKSASEPSLRGRKWRPEPLTSRRPRFGLIGRDPAPGQFLQETSATVCVLCELARLRNVTIDHACYLSASIVPPCANQDSPTSCDASLEDLVSDGVCSTPPGTDNTP